jgi:hypothetical protein
MSRECEGAVENARDFLGKPATRKNARSPYLAGFSVLFRGPASEIIDLQGDRIFASPNES